MTDICRFPGYVIFFSLDIHEIELDFLMIDENLTNLNWKELFDPNADLISRSREVQSTHRYGRIKVLALLELFNRLKDNISRNRFHLVSI